MDESATQSVPPPIEPPPSNPPGPSVSTPTTSEAPGAVPPLEYEETPEITPAVTDMIQETSNAPQPHRSGSCMRAVSIIFLVAILFTGGIWMSGYIRQLIPANSPEQKVQPPDTEQITPEPQIIADPFSGWTEYQVTSGVTRLPLSGLTYKLPPDVLPPICDSSGCISQGTFLPGGTRMTVALRGTGQSLRDFRGSLITDANGIPMPTTKLTINGSEAMIYDSSASGKTVSGYMFNRIRGAMIPLAESLSVEVNHFAPAGIVTDFPADDVLFDTIIQSFVYTPTAIPAAPTATSSGY